MPAKLTLYNTPNLSPASTFIQITGLSFTINLARVHKLAETAQQWIAKGSLSPQNAHTNKVQKSTHETLTHASNRQKKWQLQQQVKLWLKGLLVLQYSTEILQIRYGMGRIVLNRKKKYWTTIFNRDQFLKVQSSVTRWNTVSANVNGIAYMTRAVVLRQQSGQRKLAAYWKQSKAKDLKGSYGMTAADMS